MSSSYIQESATGPLFLPRTTVVPLELPWGAAGRILLSWPERTPAADGHPLLVLLGGEHQFGVARSLAALLADDGATATEAGIVAAVVLDDDGFSLPWTARPGAPSGAALAEVIAAAIDAEIAGRLPVDRHRIGAVGFGAAGRFAVEVLIARPATFAVTVAANPALWPGGQPPIDADALRDNLSALAPRQLLLIAGTDEAGVRGKRSRMAANARTIAARLADTRVAGLAVTVALVDDDDPVAIVPITISRAIRLAFAPRPAPETPS
jgi:predicted alpha/beta superfamily hydrolase